MSQSLWISYSGNARLLLAIILLSAAGIAVCTGTRFRRPVRVPRPGRTLAVGMYAAWVLAIVALLAGLTAYVRQLRLDHLLKTQPTDPITVVTATSALILFLIVFVATPSDLRGRLSSGIIAGVAAPWIFEVPFDLVVMTRTYPPVQPDPALYRAVFFTPLVLIGLITLSLLSLRATVKLSRPAFFCLALMLLVFAVWALAGFGYPSAPLPIAMNVVGKILAFVTALSLFFPEWFTPWRRNQPERHVEQAPSTGELQAQSA